MTTLEAMVSAFAPPARRGVTLPSRGALSNAAPVAADWRNGALVAPTTQVIGVRSRTAICSSDRPRLSLHRLVREANRPTPGAAFTPGSSSLVRRRSSGVPGRRKNIACAAVGGEEQDLVSRTLSQNPNRVEPRFQIGDATYTLREVQEMDTPLLLKGATAISDQLQSLNHRIRRLQKKEAEAANSEVTPAHAPTRAVYLKDLLREFKGQLYVPEEAVRVKQEDIPEPEFERHIRHCPRLSLPAFLHFTQHGQVASLVSRATATPDGVCRNYRFLVRLKDSLGEKSLQQSMWSMHLSEDEAGEAMSAYVGPQRELETRYEAYVGMPEAPPHPSAATISARAVTELAALATLLGAALAVAWKGVEVVAVAFTGVLCLFATSIVWPLSLPLRFLASRIAQGVLGLGLALGTSGVGVVQWGGEGVRAVAGRFGEGGFRGLGLLVSDARNMMASDTLSSYVRSSGAILTVIIVMAALAKFTLTRRTRDFNKWDIWQALEFSQSKPQARVEGSTGVKFEDVAGIDEVVKELQELVAYLKDPEKFSSMSTKPPHGVLLEGPPGCGKTLLAKAIAGEAGVPFYQMAGSEFVEVLVGVGAARVRDLFKRAKVNKPAVLFIDEIDALGAARGAAEGASGPDTGVQERETTLNQLLVELDGFDTGQGVIFLGATNRMDMLDPALLRPGRFDRKVAVQPPGAQGRLEVLQVHARGLSLRPSVDLWEYAKNLSGWSGAEMAQLLQEAAQVAVRRGEREVDSVDVDTALDRITLGIPRGGLAKAGAQGMVQRMALHEAGLAVTVMLLMREGADLEPPRRLSVKPRGTTLSRTIFARKDDEAYLFESRDMLVQRLRALVGGRAAEEVVYGRDTSTYSLRHLADASWMAFKMVSIWNMGEKLSSRAVAPPWHRSPSFSGPPLAFEGVLYSDYNQAQPRMGNRGDEEMTRMAQDLLAAAYAHTFALLDANKAALEEVAATLVERGEMYEEELRGILERHGGLGGGVVSMSRAEREGRELFGLGGEDGEEEEEEEEGGDVGRRVEAQKVEEV